MSMRIILIIAAFTYLILFSGCTGYKWVSTGSSFKSESGRAIWHRGHTVYYYQPEKK